MARSYSQQTVKLLFGSSTHCAFNDCSELLIVKVGGKPTVVAEIAHIRSEVPNGPRYDPDFDTALINAFENLLLMCPVHHKVIDDHPDEYPTDLLMSWKDQLVTEPGQPLTARDLVAITEFVLESSSSSAGSEAVLALSRAVGTLVSECQTTRGLPKQIASEWRAAYERTRRSLLLYDNNGERIYAEMPHVEAAKYHESLNSALNDASASISPYCSAIMGEIHAVLAAYPHLQTWCDWIQEAVNEVALAVRQWPMVPPYEDDDTLALAIEQLKRASSALASAWRGEPAEDPPPRKSVPANNPEISEVDRILEEHDALLESARPWIRVDHRPFDRDLYDALTDSLQIAYQIPPVVNLVHLDLNATTNVAAAVAKNTDEETFAELVASASQMQPMCVAMSMLFALSRVAHDMDRMTLSNLANSEIVEILKAQDWTIVQAWIDNENYIGFIFELATSLASPSSVRQQLSNTLRESPILLDKVIVGCATWSLRLSSFDYSPVGANRVYSRIPEWFPVDTVVDQIRQQMPELTPADELDSDRFGDEPRRLAAQILYRAEEGPDSP